jgi:soluble lytic murein transglycosylase-like protein
VRGLVLVLALAPAAPGQTPQHAAAERQRQSIEKQRTSVNQQWVRQQEKRSVESPFFTTGWSSPAPVSAAAAAAELPPGCEPLSWESAQPLVRAAAKRNALSPDLLRAVVLQESGWNPCAISTKGAQGLMQLMPATASWLGVADPFDPEESLDAGSRYLRHLLDRYAGDVTKALGAYNAGPGAVDRYGGVPPFPETQNYVQRILAAPARQNSGQ